MNSVRLKITTGSSMAIGAYVYTPKVNQLQKVKRSQAG